jgi:hypothetical protein
MRAGGGPRRLRNLGGARREVAARGAGTCDFPWVPAAKHLSLRRTWDRLPAAGSADGPPRYPILAPGATSKSGRRSTTSPASV